MTTRADLIETVEEIIRSWYWTGDTYTNAERAEEVLDAVLPQITTVEQLEALPDTALLISDDGQPWWFGEPADDGWRFFHSPERQCYAQRLVGFYGPLTVVWQPQPEQETRADA